MIGDEAFPAKGWNDFVVVLLDALVSSLLRIVEDKSSTERVHFMEGPYVIELRRPNAMLQIRAIERRGRDQQKGFVETRAVEFIESVLGSAQAILVALEARQHDKDALSLQANMVRLAAVAATLQA